MRIGYVLRTDIGPDVDGNGLLRRVQIEASMPEDISDENELMYPTGIDANPPAESQVVVLDVNSLYSVVVGGDDGTDPEDLEPGEIEIYSSQGGERVARIRLEVGGNVVINQGEDFAVRFSKLKEGFDQLKSDLNTFIGVFNGHVHAVSGSTTLVSGTTGTASEASIDDSKIEDVLVPGVVAP
jgi:phage gp45-like